LTAEAGAISEGADSATSHTISRHYSSDTDTCNSIPIPSIRDITSVNIDALDADSIEQLQRLLRRLKNRSHNDDDDDDDDLGSAGRVLSATEQKLVLGPGQWSVLLGAEKALGFVKSF